MIKTLCAANADDLWLEGKSLLLDHKVFTTSPSRNGPTREVLHTAMTLERPREKWIVSRSPALNPAFALVEVIWIVTGRRDSAFLNYFNNRLPAYAGHGDNYHGAYGHRLRTTFSIDQLERAYLALSHNPDSRQVVLTIWSPSLDLPDREGRPIDPDIPCNLISMLKIRDSKLHWTQIMRSNDIFLGIPHNIIQFTSLQEIMAGWLGLELGSYNHFSDSLHVYEKDISKLKASVKVDVAGNPDSLALPKTESDLWFGQLAGLVDRMLDVSLSSTQFNVLSSRLEAPESISNVHALICAESARRRKLHKECNIIMDRCTNPVYQALWERWLKRVHSKQDLDLDASGCSRA